MQVLGLAGNVEDKNLIIYFKQPLIIIEDLACPKSFGELLLKSILNNFKDGTKDNKSQSSNASRLTSTPEYKRVTEAIVTKNKKIRETLKAQRTNGE